MKNTKSTIDNHEAVLKEIAESIDISDSQKKIAIECYEEIGKWLDSDDSDLKDLNPVIYPQGSFRLGTVIRPIGDKEEFDIDLVCKLDLSKDTDISMKILKEIVGREIRGYSEYHGMSSPEDKRRCWTLEYSDSAKFHLDILPSLSNQLMYSQILAEAGHIELANNSSYIESAVSITDNTDPNYSVKSKNWSKEWPLSNPKGYATWFHSRQKANIILAKEAILEAKPIYASVEDVPDNDVKTPLQQSIQLLKRHRDSMFEDEEDKKDKPISIIITTLSALAYKGEETICKTLENVLENMGKYIEDSGGVSVVSNPVWPQENFADKWDENPPNQKKEKFFRWLEEARKDFGTYIFGEKFNEFPDCFESRMTKETISKVQSSIGPIAAPILSPTQLAEKEVQRVKNSGQATKPWSINAD